MVENPVQNQRYPAGSRGEDKVFKVVFVAEQAVRLFVISRVVTVVGARFEYGVEIYGGNAEGLQIIEFCLYALKVAAEKIIVPMNRKEFVI